MGTIESSIGKVSSNDQQTLKKYIVDDPTAINSTTDVDVFDQRNRLIAAQFAQRERLNQESQNMEDHSFDIRAKQPNQKLNYEEQTQYMTMVQEARSKKNEIAPDKKKKIEILLGLKQKTRSLEIEGHKLTLKSLSAKATKTIFEKMYSVQGSQDGNDKVSSSPVEKMFDMRHLTLVYALDAIDDEKISDLLGDMDDFEVRLSLIEEMSEDVVKELYDFYEMNVKTNIPITKEETKEFVGDIKKL